MDIGSSNSKVRSLLPSPRELVPQLDPNGITPTPTSKGRNNIDIIVPFVHRSFGFRLT